MLVRYRVSESQLTTTIKGDETLVGSVHHPELVEFTGLVVREHENGRADLVIFPPNGTLRHVNDAAEGDGPGSFTRMDLGARQ